MGPAGASTFPLKRFDKGKAIKSTNQGSSWQIGTGFVLMLDLRPHLSACLRGWTTMRHRNAVRTSQLSFMTKVLKPLQQSLLEQFRKTMDVERGYISLARCPRKTRCPGKTRRWGFTEDLSPGNA